MSNPIPDYQPYLGGAFRWRLGLRPLDVANWIEIGDDFDHQMDVKQQVMASHHATVNAFLDDTQDEGGEVLEHLAEHLVLTRPDWFFRDGEDIVNGARHEKFRIVPNDDGSWAEHPLATCGRMVQEDLALLVDRDDKLIFGGGSVCFPNRWDLSSKLGLSLFEVHAPVNHLNEQLQDPIDSFFGRLTVEKPFWRLGWGVLDTSDPYQAVDGSAPVSPQIPAVGDPTTGDRLFLRVERETLRRFPRTNCVLFTIRTYIRPLSHLVQRPQDAKRLAQALISLPDDVRDYKRTTELTDAAVQWLNSLENIAVS